MDRPRGDEPDVEVGEGDPDERHPRIELVVGIEPAGDVRPEPLAHPARRDSCFNPPPHRCRQAWQPERVQPDENGVYRQDERARRRRRSRTGTITIASGWTPPRTPTAM